MNTQIHYVSSSSRLLHTAFWTLWTTSIGFTAYGLAVELFGLSIFGQGSVPKYHMSTEAYIVGVVALSATLMLAAMSPVIWRSSRPLRRFSIAAFVFQLFYLGFPRF